MADKILAKVGAQVITEKDVDEFIMALGQRGAGYNTPEGRRAILKQLIDNKLLLLDAQRNLYEADAAFRAELAKLKENGAQPSNYIAEYAKQRDRLKAMLKALKKDKTYAAEQMDIQTFENFSGVEMVHFCKNDLAQPIWDASPLVNQSMGQTLFWYFILPLVQNLTKVVGCQYFYLFAADGSKEESLVGYYQYTLHFEIREDLSFRKPAYDVCCLPMCRKLKDLEPYRKDFFQNFNRPKPPKKAENEE
jgi:hypothetical protein